MNNAVENTKVSSETRFNQAISRLNSINSNAYRIAKDQEELVNRLIGYMPEKEVSDDCESLPSQDSFIDNLETTIKTYEEILRKIEFQNHRLNEQF